MIFRVKAALAVVLLAHLPALIVGADTIAGDLGTEASPWWIGMYPQFEWILLIAVFMRIPTLLLALAIVPGAVILIRRREPGAAVLIGVAVMCIAVQLYTELRHGL